MLKIYLAGPDVFLSHALEHGEYLKKLCSKYGFEGHFPLDNVIQEDTPSEIALKIQHANQAMIQQCDIVLANLSPFRGPEPDSGTVWEIGYAQGLGKKVFAYSSNRDSLKKRTQTMLGLGDASHDHEGLLIEDFGLSHNLMFASLVIADSFEGSLQYLSASLLLNE